MVVNKINITKFSSIPRVQYLCLCLCFSERCLLGDLAYRGGDDSRLEALSGERRDLDGDAWRDLSVGEIDLFGNKAFQEEPRIKKQNSILPLPSRA